jgi:hypothetical protein
MNTCGFHDPTTTPLGDAFRGMPALHGRNREAELCSHRSDPAEFFEDTLHDDHFDDVRLAHLTPSYSVRQSHYHVRGEFRTVADMEPVKIIAALKRLGVTHDEIAEALGRDRSVATKMLAGDRKVQASEIKILADLIQRHERHNNEVEDVAPRGYLPVEILPSFAGMGGGGTGEGDRESGLVSRRLIENELGASPKDMLIIEARGDSMEPDFQHGDQILIDCRDRNPIQPGPFAMWDGDGYVVKIVERLPQQRGWYRVFSANGRYASYDVEESTIKIMGRPVWFGRRL